MYRHVLAVALPLILCGCRGKVESQPPPKFRQFPMVGVVKKTDVSRGRLTIAHEKIPGYMEAMTMELRVAESEKPTLEDLQVGDKVSATLRVDDEHSELRDLQVTEPAPPPSLTLDMSGNTPTLRERAKRLEVGEVVPDFAVTTQDGQALRLSDLRGKVVAFTFIYTRCPIPEFCPAMDKRFAELSKQVATVPARVNEVRLLSISFDPEHDSPEVLAKHAKLRGAKPPLWQYAVASHAELAKIAERVGLVYGPGESVITHSLNTAIVGPDGKLAALYGGSEWTVDQAFKVIRECLPK